MKIQLWAPGLDASAVVQAVLQAQRSPLVLPDLAALQREFPVLLIYAEPMAWVPCIEAIESAAPLSGLLTALPEVLAAGIDCRLVNLSCLALPSLVAWCVDPASPPLSVTPTRFPRADLFDALLAIEWLHVHPDQLQAYQALEVHPLAAVLDQRPPDLNCLERYRQAASLEALLRTRKEWATHLAYCEDLQLGVQAQQLDLEQLARRLELLEQLVEISSDASLRVQMRLAQSLA